jgi:hypothetical protein
LRFRRAGLPATSAIDLIFGLDASALVSFWNLAIGIYSLGFAYWNLEFSTKGMLCLRAKHHFRLHTYPPPGTIASDGRAAKQFNMFTIEAKLPAITVSEEQRDATHDNSI